MTLLFLIYGAAGGLTAAIVTDFIQGILTIILSFMLLPVALRHVGYFSGLREKIADESVFTIVSPGEINAFHIIMLCLSALVGIVTQPHIMGVCAAGKTEMDGRFGFATGNLIKRLCTIAWMLVGLCGIAMYPVIDSADNIYGRVAKDLLPTVTHGLVGVFLAALLASIMSSCDAFMVSSSGLFTQNFYRRYVVDNRAEDHYVRVGRIMSGVIVAGSLVTAFFIPDIPTALEWFFIIQALMGAAFWLGLFWRGATVVGVWVGTVAALAVWWLTSLPALQPSYAENLPEWMIWNGKLRTSWSIFFYLSTAFGLTTLVSLVTPRVPKERLDRLFECIRTPVTANEPHGAPFTLPDGVQPANPRKIINHPDFEIYVPQRVSIIGFAVFWVFVFSLIAFVFWLSGLGK
jgi:Na+/proline symporter